MTNPPTITYMSTISENIKYPIKVAHTNCRKLIGWIIIIGADFIAWVKVMCPRVAKIATILKLKISFIDGWTHTEIAGGASISVTNTLSMQTITKELCFFVSSLDNKYEIANKGADIIWANWPDEISWKPGLRIISVPINAIKIAIILHKPNISPKKIAAPILK